MDRVLFRFGIICVILLLVVNLAYEWRKAFQEPPVEEDRFLEVSKQKGKWAQDDDEFRGYHGMGALEYIDDLEKRVKRLEIYVEQRSGRHSFYLDEPGRSTKD